MKIQTVAWMETLTYSFTHLTIRNYWMCDLALITIMAADGPVLKHHDLTHDFLQSVILLSNIVTYNCNISVWNWPNTTDI